MLGEILDRIERLNLEAIQLFQNAQFEQAMPPAVQAERLARQHFAQHTAHAETLNTLASLYYQLGDYAQAEPLFRQALEINRHSVGEHHPEYARDLCNLAVLCQCIGKYTEAEKLYRQALDIRRATIGERSPIYATNLNNLAKLYEHQSNYQKAEPLLRQALEIMRITTGEESSGFARALLALGEMYDSMGSHAKAEPLFLQALQVIQEAIGERHPDFAACLTNLGDLYRSMGKHARAKECLQQASQVLRAVYGEDHPIYAANLSRLGNLYQESGDFAQAESILRRTCDTARQVHGESHESCATALSNLAILYFRMGDLDSAEPLFFQALEIRRKTVGELHPDFACSLSHLATLSDVSGAHYAAEPLYWQALEILRKTVGDDHPSYANCLNDLGAMYFRMDRFKEAEPLYRQARDIWCGAHGKENPSYALSLNNLASVYDALGDFSKAEMVYREACSILQRIVGEEHPSFAACLKNLAGACAALGRPVEAFTFAHKALAVEQRMIGTVFAFGTESQRMLFLKTLQNDFFTLLSLVLGYHSHSPATVGSTLDLVLQRKAISAEALAVQRDVILGGRYPQLKPDLEQLSSLRMQIARRILAGPGAEGVQAHQLLLAEWSAQKDHLQSELSRQTPEMNLERQLQAVDRRAVALTLPAGLALVEFVRVDMFHFQAVTAQGESRWHPARYLAFVLSAGEADHVQLIDLGEAEPIDQMIADFRASITGEREQDTNRDMVKTKTLPVPPDENRVGRALRTAVFDPLASAFSDRKRLFLAPDGDLARLPFEVLPTDDGRFLIDDYSISYLGCGRDVLRFQASPAGQPAEALVAADPDFDLSSGTGSASASKEAASRQSRDMDASDLSFDRLPGTRDEGTRVAKLLNVQPWLQGEVLEQRLKQVRSPWILHLATHGFFLEDQHRDPNQERSWTAGSDLGRLSGLRLENPLLRSGLVLAGGNTWLKKGPLPPEAEDGLLTAEDVTGMDLLDTELVVLSACNTGLGEIRTGEGVFGLRRAFVLAGAKTLVMSLWKVPDQETCELMEDFYRRILAGEPRAEALRSAQLAMKAKYPHPFYWGAFICQGNPGPLPPRRRAT